jgi:predicted DNA-binding transcriptional regulator AlpA
MTEWAVTVTMAGTRPESYLVELEDRLPSEDYFVAALPTYEQFSVTGTVTASEWRMAADLVVEMVERVAGGPIEIVGVDVLERDEYDRRADEPTMPEVVSAPEVADILGVSRQRVHQILSGNPRFPEPLFRLGSGPVWSRQAIESFQAKWERKPGRPVKLPV